MGLREMRDKPTDRRIYVVDDDLTNRMLFRSLLNMHGFRNVMEFYEGAQLMRWMELREERRTPDLVIMDTKMNGGPRGYEFCKQIRQQDFGNGMGIIGMSSAEHYEQKWMTAGADRFLPKDEMVRDAGEMLGHTVNDVLKKYL